jgi:hypothetical protein
MSAFDLTGIVKECWKYHPIDNQNDGVNEDRGPLADLYSSALKITVNFDQIPMKDVKVFFYNEWALRCQFLAPGDKITLSGSAELLRGNMNPEEDREHMCCIALREDEVGKEPLFIRVSIQRLCCSNESISINYKKQILTSTFN